MSQERYGKAKKGENMWELFGLLFELEGLGRPIAIFAHAFPSAVGHVSPVMADGWWASG